MCSAPSDHFVEAIHHFPIVFACKRPRNSDYADQPVPFDSLSSTSQGDSQVEPKTLCSEVQHNFGGHSSGYFFAGQLGSMIACCNLR